MTLYEKYGLVIPLQRYLDDLEASTESGESVFSAEIVASSVPLARHRIAVCAYLMGDLVCARKHGASFREALPDSVTVTNCAVVYPQGNVGMRQGHVWPFYEIKGFATEEGETNAVSVYVYAK